MPRGSPAAGRCSPCRQAQVLPTMLLPPTKPPMPLLQRLQARCPADDENRRRRDSPARVSGGGKGRSQPSTSPPHPSSPPPSSTSSPHPLLTTTPPPTAAFDCAVLGAGRPAPWPAVLAVGHGLVEAPNAVLYRRGGCSLPYIPPPPFPTRQKQSRVEDRGSRLEVFFYRRSASI